MEESELGQCGGEGGEAVWKSELGRCGGVGGEAVWRRVSWVGVEE